MLFYLFAAVAVVASLLVIAQRNPIYSVLLLIVSFCALSGLYVLLEAPFVAVIQIVVYAGAIMVLFLFVVMLLNAPHEDTERDEYTHTHAAELARGAGAPGVRTLGSPGVVRFGAVLAAKLGPVLGTGGLHDTLSTAGSAAALVERSALAQSFQIVFFGTSAGFALSLVALWRLEERPLRAGRPAGAPDDLTAAESAND